MSTIFISHRSADSAEAADLKAWLAREGHTELFLDFDPMDGLPAGVDWEQRLYRELRRCQALLVVLTPAWLESKWCSNELAIAREKGKAVFVARVKPCAGCPIIPSLQEVDLTTDRAAGLARLARGLKEHGIDPADAFTWNPNRPIYPGLASFDVEDAAIFFGREMESIAAAEGMRRLRLQPPGSPKLLLITGASGSGKSSLMRAGLLARLRKELENWIITNPFRRGGDAFLELARVLAFAYPIDRRPSSFEALADRLRGTDGHRQLIGIASELQLARNRPGATLVLALDQAEELLAPDAGPDAAALLDLLREALARSAQDLMVVATVRSDRLGTWKQHGSVKADTERVELAFEAFPLGPMPMDRLGNIVRKPAEREGLVIDDDLIDALKEDTGTSDALSLLAYTLRHLHDLHGADQRLTLGEYQSIGRLEGSVKTQAEATIDVGCLDATTLETLRDAFVPGLVRATEDGSFVKRPARLAALPATAHPLIRRLCDEARLLVLDRDREGQETVEIAHEALLRVWPLLKGWITDDAAKLQQLAAIQRAASQWSSHSKNTDFLIHRRDRLREAEGLAAQPRFGGPLDATARSYLAACRKAQNESDERERQTRERELRDAQELARRRKIKVQGAVAASVLLLLVAAAALWQWRQTGLARDQANEALIRSRRANAIRLAAEARSSLKTQPQRALLLATMGVQTWMKEGDPRIPFTLEMLEKALQRNAGRPIGAHLDNITEVKQSATGKWLAVTSNDGTASLWQLTTTDPTGRGVILEGHTHPVVSARFDKTESWLATKDKEGGAFLWDLSATPPRPTRLDDRVLGVSELAFAPDGSWLAVTLIPHGRLSDIDLNHSVVRLFALRPGLGAHKATDLVANEGNINDFRFSDNARWLAVSRGAAALLFDLSMPAIADSRAMVPLRGDYVHHVKFSPDSRWIAAASWGGGVDVWQLKSGAGGMSPHRLPSSLYLYRGHLLFTPDSHKLITWGTLRATAGEDYNPRVWTLDDLEGTTPHVASGHTANISEVVLSDDGRWLATGGSKSGQVMLHDLTIGKS